MLPTRYAVGASILLALLLSLKVMSGSEVSNGLTLSTSIAEYADRLTMHTSKLLTWASLEPTHTPGSLYRSICSIASIPSLAMDVAVTMVILPFREMWLRLCGILGSTFDAARSFHSMMSAVVHAIGNELDPEIAKLIICLVYASILMAASHLLRSFAWILYSLAWVFHTAWPIVNSTMAAILRLLRFALQSL